MELEFKTLEELYQRLYPALKIKKRELYRLGFPYIQEEDIWDYFRIYKWSKSHNLMLSEMVNDILNTDHQAFQSFLQEKNSQREKNQNENDLSEVNL